MLNVIDRRLAGKNKSIENRERFLRRYKDQIRQKVADAVRDQSIRHIDGDTSVSIPRRDISEPAFRHGQGGVRNIVHAGNKEYVAGDRLKRPQGGGQGGKPQASDDGEGEDDFTFSLTREEFMNYLFEDLALPRLARTEVITLTDFKTSRAGFSATGAPANLHVVRSLRNAIGRRIALNTPSLARVRELEAELEALLETEAEESAAVVALREEIARLRARIAATPYLDPTDLRFVSRVRVPQPCVQAVMFCLMDVSGSMDEARKDLAKRFFLMLYLFLSRSYERVDIVFIRHHTQADEVDEDTFFHSRESGGTVVSSALELMARIVNARYSPTEWNIYGAQASDGDNWNNDSERCTQILREQLLPASRYFAYIQVVADEQNLWTEYEALAATQPHFVLRKATSPGEIYPVFRDLFKKSEAA